jgi:drug/metabolite transporter (DMT)-like permease
VLFFEIIRLAGPTFFAQFYLAVLAGVGWSIAIFGEGYRSISSSPCC